MGFMHNPEASTQSTLKARAVILDTTHSHNARLRAVPIDAVHLSDDFWQPRRERNRDVTLISQFEKCRLNGYFDNFNRAAGIKDIAFQGLHWNDSDVYKWLEAAAWSMAQPGAGDELQAMVEQVVVQIEAMQQADGNLHSYFLFDKAEQRFTWLENSHELYCVGHFIQAAVAHFRSTGQERLLQVARRAGDFLHRTFGPAENQLPLTDGHQEIEMALIELARATGEGRYLETARFFVDVRARGGVKPIPQLDHLGLAYHQSHRPLEEQSEAVGHAVRAMYYYCAGADLTLEGDDQFAPAMKRLWHDVTTRKMHITGGLGARHDGEAFGAAYELPNASTYCETCAAIGLVMWAHRMLLLTGEAGYADVMERALYNGVLSGLSLDGTEYFYVNPLENDGKHRRSQWFGCACCPPNVARLLAQLPGYFYSTSHNAIWLHLYAQCTTTVELQDEQRVTLNLQTQYPWQGEISLAIEEISGQSTFALHLRVPNWCANATVEINGEAHTYNRQNGYCVIAREWHNGDKVLLHLPMPAQRVEAHPDVAEDRGCVALQRGPLVYCVEACDQQHDLREITLPATSPLQEQWRAELLGGVMTITAEAWKSGSIDEWQNTLYRPVRSTSGQTVLMTAIPYFAWANREVGAMRVWIPQATSCAACHKNRYHGS
ncbi:MAG: uncharacterized protein JWN98_895 [Abditibacteriota bacterium]|nr:uncharacterized protein [Abditibacteriota bacterium]